MKRIFGMALAALCAFGIFPAAGAEKAPKDTLVVVNVNDAGALDMQRGEHDIFIFGRSFPLPAPDIFLTSSFATASLKGMNYCRFSDPEVDRLLDKARVEPNPAKRAQLYETVQHRLEDLTTWIPVYTLEQVAGTQDYVRNFVLDARSYYYFGDVVLSDM